MTELILDRRAHQCRHDGCDSQAQHKLWLILRLAGHIVNPQTFRCESTLQVCDRHVHAATKFVMSSENRQRIAAGMLRAGMGMPDFSSVVVALEPIDAPPPEVRRPLQ